MVSLADLWLPILTAAVFVFLVSSVMHMCIPIHKSDYEELPDEDRVKDSLREAGVGPGAYVFPHCESMKDLGTPETLEKFKKGPVGFMIIQPNGPPTMGKALGQWFVFTIVISVFVAYLGSLSGLAVGADGMAVFRFTATVAFLGYGMGSVCDSIWKGIAWVVTAKFLFDGALYALATGAAFMWLWPSL